jgi:hypothetical protein
VSSPVRSSGFGPDPRETPLELVESKTFRMGVRDLTYRPAGE